MQYDAKRVHGHPSEIVSVERGAIRPKSGVGIGRTEAVRQELPLSPKAKPTAADSTVVLHAVPLEVAVPGQSDLGAGQSRTTVVGASGLDGTVVERLIEFFRLLDRWESERVRAGVRSVAASQASVEKRRVSSRLEAHNGQVLIHDRAPLAVPVMPDSGTKKLSPRDSAERSAR